MSRVVLAAEATGFAVWFLLGWALLNRLAMLAARAGDERRRRKHARRRLRRWRPVARQRDPDRDVTTVLPAIQRPKGP